MSLLNASLDDLSSRKRDLPPPHPDAIIHSQKVLTHIINKIRQHNGLISFAEYMQLALYAPHLGYYMVGTQKFGRSGDFVTAPELSSLFSECLAQEIATVLHYLKGGDILELGAGSGILAAEILATLQQLDQLPNRYFILELSPELKVRQQQTLQRHCPEVFSIVHWLDRLPENRLRGLVLANELCDAMPVHRFMKKGNNFFELCVKETAGKLAWQAIPITNQAKFLSLADLQSFLALNIEEEVYCSEINLHLKPWVRALSHHIEQGVCLLIDYGFPRMEYYHRDRSMGSLMCHYQHYAHSDPFFYPGLQDITAHLDFTTIAEAAESAGLEILGFTNQASFLISCGLLDLANQSQSNTFKGHHAMQMLTSPAEMGEIFKVMALGKNYAGPLKGFALNDKRHRL